MITVAVPCPYGCWEGGDGCCHQSAKDWPIATNLVYSFSVYYEFTLRCQYSERCGIWIIWSEENLQSSGFKKPAGSHNTHFIWNHSCWKRHKSNAPIVRRTTQTDKKTGQKHCPFGSSRWSCPNTFNLVSEIQLVVLGPRDASSYRKSAPPPRSVMPWAS